MWWMKTEMAGRGIELWFVGNEGRWGNIQNYWRRLFWRTNHIFRTLSNVSARTSKNINPSPLPMILIFIQFPRFDSTDTVLPTMDIYIYIYIYI